MKKVIFAFMAIVALAMAGCKDETIEPSLTLDKTNLTVKVGQTLQIIATVKPEGSATVTWESQDKEVAYPSENGNVCNVTGITTGHTVIVATAGDMTASCNVEVVK